MTHRHPHSRALCICLAILGLTAFNASAAYGSGWMLEGHELESGQLPTVVIRGHGTLLFKVVGLHVKVLCTGMGTVGAHLVWGIPPVRLLGNMRYLSCTVRLVVGGKEEEVACTVKSPGQAAGVILSNELEGELTLVEKEGVAVLKPKSGETLETLLMTGAECPLPETNPINGKLALKDSGGTASLETEAKVHTLEEGPGTEMWLGKKTVEHKTTLGGKFEAELESIKQWSGLPG